MLGIILFLLISFLIGLPFYWLYKLIFKKKKIDVNKEPKIAENKSETKVSDLIAERKYLFMEDYKMWKGLSESEKKDRLTDIQVIFDYGKDLITKEMIKKGFQSGSKIIDIKYFSGLSEFGSGIVSFLIQHEEGGEIRELSIRINLKDMEFIATRNGFYSNGKEKYWYLKDKNKDLMKI
ncbi:hypothetical protein [Polaribacter sp. IC063]|jgi:hypothetical protein|uniref:hypothetical protein n=1 Tax=Polaribacter sp. IC063 TaxID=57031 RepID=UPI0011BE46BD|nr:hypothetical protein [Polaribacter sp. IC063]TXD48111.1 hypothetical protein ES043_18030 [Polaribacter sp. IC063]